MKSIRMFDKYKRDGYDRKYGLIVTKRERGGLRVRVVNHSWGYVDDIYLTADERARLVDFLKES